MISVITISNSREKLLKTFFGVIESVENSDLKKVQYVIVEADSSEKTNEKDLTHACKNLEIKYIRIKKGGFSIQRNIGVKESEYNILVFIDDGMDIPKSWIKKITEPILKKEADAVLGSVIPKTINTDGNTKEKLSTYLKNILILSQGVLGFPAGGFKLMAQGRSYIDSFSTSNLAIVKKLITETGMFDENLVFGAEDSDLSIRIKKKFPDARFLYNPDAYVFTEPRKTLSEIKKWFIRRGKSFATLTKKYEKRYIKRLVRRELILPKILISAVSPISLIFFFALYITETQRILSKASENQFFPKEYKNVLRIALPFIKLYMDFYYSKGYYSEIFKNEKKIY
ncbi:MAG: glycosyltransferase [Candidatus Calescibacterium sp.]|nr:glycosyltransferase [Candidatus Calescibacterium sp.]MCX7733877.1 glycosyltransferase [bacterium]MDW8086658.1 glycosyltransferase [Candidatus Calescibacterium sp.]